MGNYLDCMPSGIFSICFTGAAITMANSDDDDLMLNLNDNATTSSGSPKKQLKKKSQWQSQRDRKYHEKEKKIKRKQNRNDQHGNWQEDHDVERLASSAKKATSASNVSIKANTKGFTENSFQMVSSLFTKNPVIPDLPTKQFIKRESYELFSEKPANETQLSERLLKAMKDRLGFEKFTEVQKQAIPAFLSNSDVLIKSPTGSGKTLAYALPMIQRLQQVIPKISRTDGPYAIVLLPTRELAVQSYEIIENLCRTFVWIVPGLIVGGEKRKAEKSRIRKGINVVVATPGRLLDHLNTTKSLSLNNLLVLVFDEADRLLDMGFEQTVSQILAHIKEQCNRKIQTGLLSATLSARVENLASISLQDPKLIDLTKSEGKVANSGEEIKEEIAFDSSKTEKGEAKSLNSEENVSSSKDFKNEQKFQTPTTLKQYFVIVPAKLRLVCLISFLSKFGFRSENGKVIVFFSNKSSTELHFSLLESDPVKELVASSSCDLYKLHGDMMPNERNEVFQKFKRCKKGILLSTDVAARGLDLPRVSWIVQYSCPTQIEDYVHRVGRTARIGTEGESLLFLLPSEVKYVAALEEKDIDMQKLGLFDILKYLDPKCGKKSNQSITQKAATDLQNSLEIKVAESNILKVLAESAFRSFIQSYATYPSNLKEIFHVKRLHLGHIAKSFALRTAPQQMKNLNIDGLKSGKAKEKKSETKHRKRKAVDMSESGGGVVINGPRPGGGKPKRKKKKQ